MGGGLMQLVAYGAQDIYLTGNPQITFFKVVYRRHTNFSMECVQQAISGVSTVLSTASSQATVIISRSADLVHQIWVRCDQDTTNGISGDYLIEEAEIEIGGHRIDKQTREWMQIWTELTTPSNHTQGFKYLTGGYSNPFVTGSQTNQQSIMVPLQFWFCRDIGLSLPLIALQYHEVKLKVTWGSGASATPGLGRNGSAVTPSCEVWVDYIYLDTDERRRFAQVSHEYLIEQLQVQDEGLAGELYKLNLEHPVKELIWTTETSNLTTQKTKLELDGHDRFSFQDREYFQIKQPLQHHSNVPGYNIKEMEKPQLLSIPKMIISGINKSAATAGDGTFEINAATTSNLKIGTASSGTVEELSVGDVLLIHYTVAAGEEGVSLVATVGNVRTSPVAGSQVGIYDVLLDSGNSATTANTPTASVNGDGSILLLARTQDPQSRCSQLTRDINVYSFAIHPEDHQPSGACNFSKIDHAKLMFDSSTTVEVIYAVNYNILRIMSGMGGLAYAN